MVSTAKLFTLLLLAGIAVPAAGQGLEAFSVTTGPEGEQTYSVTLQVLALMTGLTLLPAALIMTTASPASSSSSPSCARGWAPLRLRRARCCSVWPCS